MIISHHQAQMNGNIIICIYNICVMYYSGEIELKNILYYMEFNIYIAERIIVCIQSKIKTYSGDSF